MSARRALAAICVAAVAGSGVGVARAAFVATTSNGTNNFSAAADTAPPTVSRAIVAKTSGATPGTIRQGGAYYVYAQVTDSSGVSSVTANASSFTGGAASASLSTGSWTIGGQGYNYRSAQLTADSPLVTGSSYSYTITATDAASNSTSPSYSAAIEDYASVLSATSGLISHWRLGDGAISADELVDSSGVTLQTHTGDLDASWTRHGSSSSTMIFTAANRVRKNSTGTAIYYTGAAPSSANYSVEADIYYASSISGQESGVIGRASTSANTYYVARYDQSVGAWNLAKYVNGTPTTLGTNYTQTLTAGATYRLTLTMNGSTISLSVDGVQRISATDTSISSAGRGGLRAADGTVSPTNTTGIHTSVFRVTSLTTTATDSQGSSTNNGTYTNGPLLNQPGALTGDTNRSSLFDGVNDHVTVPHASTLNLGDGPLTLEAWIKRSNTSDGSIIEKGSSGGAYEIWISGNRLTLRSPGVADIVQSTTTIADTNWHHVVGTKDGATSRLYIDGVDRTGTVTNQTMVNHTFPLELSGGPRFAGQLDEAAIYSSALSAATVLDHYRAGSGTG